MSKIIIFQNILILIGILWSIVFVIMKLTINLQHVDNSDDNYYDSYAYTLIKNIIKYIYTVHLMNFIVSIISIILYLLYSTEHNSVMFLYVFIALYYTHLIMGLTFQINWIYYSDSVIDSWNEHVYNLWVYYVFESIFVWTKFILTSIYWLVNYIKSKKHNRSLMNNTHSYYQFGHNQE